MNWGELKDLLHKESDSATIFIGTDDDSGLAHEFSKDDVLVNPDGDILIVMED